MGEYSSGAAAITAFFVIYFLIIIFVVIASYVLQALSLSFLFRKVGVEPWKAWVPYYNTWLWLELGGQKGWLSLLAFIPGGAYVTLVFLYIGMYRTNRAFGQSTGLFVLGIFFPFIWCFVLGGGSSQYRPEVFQFFGWPPPYIGYGGVPAERRLPDAEYARYAAQQAQQQWPAQPPQY